MMSYHDIIKKNSQDTYSIVICYGISNKLRQKIGIRNGKPLT